LIYAVWKLLLSVQDDAKQGLVEVLEENSIDLVITGSATTSRFRKTLNVRRPLTSQSVATAAQAFKSLRSPD